MKIADEITFQLHPGEPKAPHRSGNYSKQLAASEISNNNPLILRQADR
jgi:hypothetical protein